MSVVRSLTRICTALIKGVLHILVQCFGSNAAWRILDTQKMRKMSLEELAQVNEEEEAPENGKTVHKYKVEPIECFI